MIGIWMVFGALQTQLHAQVAGCGFQCDFDGNAHVNFSDLAQILSLYGEEVGGDTLMECSDITAPITMGEFDTSQDGLINYADLLDFFTEWGLSCPLAEAGPCGYEKSLKFNGHTYPLAEIGGRCWFASDLRVTTYRNGDIIPGDLYQTEWSGTTEGARAVYGEGASACYTGNCDASQNAIQYGQLYNFFAVADPRGLCPDGWHVPTDVEWVELIDSLGGAEVAGEAMKAPACMSAGWNGTNSSFFTGLPAGFRSSAGYFIYEGDYGYWWSSTPQGMNDAWRRSLSTSSTEVGLADADQNAGQSVRCIKDEE